MARAYETSPLDREPEQGFNFTDATLLAFIGVVTLTLLAVLLLGGLCAEHRIAAELARL